MGVRPDMRKKGIGRHLASHALLNAKEVGLQHIVLPWINDKEPFYRKIVGNAERVVFNKYVKSF
jgi:GNAT superfamily N-acetyltransferase